MLLKRTKFQRFLNCTILVQTFLFFDCFWIKTNEWVNELTNCHWRRFSTSSWVNELREHLNRNNILAVKQSSSEQRLNQSTWTEVEPLQRVRPRNDLSQRRGISGYIWSAHPDSGFQAAVILEEEEGAKGTTRTCSAFDFTNTWQSIVSVTLLQSNIRPPWYGADSNRVFGPRRLVQLPA